MFKRLLCFVFGHAPPPGVTRRLSIAFHCARCGALASGDFAAVRR